MFVTGPGKVAGQLTGRDGASCTKYGAGSRIKRHLRCNRCCQLPEELALRIGPTRGNLARR